MTVIKGILFSILILLASCDGTKTLDRDDYLAYYNEPKSHFYKEKEISDVIYKIKMQLPEFFILNDNPAISESEYQSELTQKSDQVNFTFLMLDQGNSNLVKNLVFNAEAYSKLLKYANTELIKHIKLINDNKELDCSMLHVEPANSVQPIIRMSFSFSHVNRKTQDLTLVFDDHFFNNGELKFRFGENAFNNLPTLKL